MPDAAAAIVAFITAALWCILVAHTVQAFAEWREQPVNEAEARTLTIFAVLTGFALGVRLVGWLAL